MKAKSGIGLCDVQTIYNGPVGDLWELVMGEQIHVGGFNSSLTLAEKAGIGKGMSGIDLCCCNGAGMRFLVRFRDVSSMRGVDATETVVRRGVDRCREAGLSDRIRFTLADVCESGLPDSEADFIWGEDAWCYVENKSTLISEAARLVKPGGLIAFTDWIEGPVSLSEQEADRFLEFMKFPNIQDMEGYCALLLSAGCSIICAENTGLFAPCVDLYLDMLTKQLTYDALKIIGYDLKMMETLGGEMAFTQKLAHADKIVQCRIIARKNR
jgi:SAM-dependent methyltransferase